MDHRTDSSPSRYRRGQDDGFRTPSPSDIDRQSPLQRMDTSCSPAFQDDEGVMDMSFSPALNNDRSASEDVAHDTASFSPQGMRAQVGEHLTSSMAPHTTSLHRQDPDHAPQPAGYSGNVAQQGALRHNPLTAATSVQTDVKNPQLPILHGTPGAAMDVRAAADEHKEGGLPQMASILQRTSQQHQSSNTNNHSGNHASSSSHAGSAFKKYTSPLSSSLPSNLNPPLIRVHGTDPSTNMVPAGVKSSSLNATSTLFHPPPHSQHLHTVVQGATVRLVDMYRRCNTQFKYSHQGNPKRALTKPSVGTRNDGYDNENSDLILYVNDALINQQASSGIKRRYIIQEMLGQGTFGQVAACICEEESDDSCLMASAGQPRSHFHTPHTSHTTATSSSQATGGVTGGISSSTAGNTNNKSLVAVKVIKNQPAYYHQARVEIGLLQFLNSRCDPDDKHHIVRMTDFFLFRKHLCLVFEKLDVNLFELLKRNSFRGLSLSLVQLFLRQILDSLAVLRDASIIHCDLKPENILLKNATSGEIKLIDFGSACFENRTVYSYIQSRFYRSPEVVLGSHYNVAIDMWSLGCVAAELFLGLPLFPGASEHDLLSRIIETLGNLPAWLLLESKNTDKFFRRQAVQGLDGQLIHRHVLLSRHEFEARNSGMRAHSGKRYFSHASLPDIIGAYPLRTGLSDEEVMKERTRRAAFTDFLLGVLDLDPKLRWTPRQAALHPFVTGASFQGPYQPQPDERQPLLPLAFEQQQQQSMSSESVSMFRTAAAAAAAGVPGSMPSQKQQQQVPVVGSIGSGSSSTLTAQAAVSAMNVNQQQSGVTMQQSGVTMQQVNRIAANQNLIATASAAAAAQGAAAASAHALPASAAAVAAGQHSAMVQAQAHAIAMATLQQMNPQFSFMAASGGHSIGSLAAAPSLGTSYGAGDFGGGGLVLSTASGGAGGGNNTGGGLPWSGIPTQLLGSSLPPPAHMFGMSGSSLGGQIMNGPTNTMAISAASAQQQQQQQQYSLQYQQMISAGQMMTRQQQPHTSQIQLGSTPSTHSYQPNQQQLLANPSARLHGFGEHGALMAAAAAAAPGVGGTAHPPSAGAPHYYTLPSHVSLHNNSFSNAQQNAMLGQSLSSHSLQLSHLSPADMQNVMFMAAHAAARQQAQQQQQQQYQLQVNAGQRQQQGLLLSASSVTGSDIAATSALYHPAHYLQQQQQQAGQLMHVNQLQLPAQQLVGFHVPGSTSTTGSRDSPATAAAAGNTQQQQQLQQQVSTSRRSSGGTASGQRRSHGGGSGSSPIHRQPKQQHAASTRLPLVQQQQQQQAGHFQFSQQLAEMAVTGSSPTFMSHQFGGQNAVMVTPAAAAAAHGVIVAADGAAASTAAAAAAACSGTSTTRLPRRQALVAASRYEVSEDMALCADNGDMDIDLLVPLMMMGGDAAEDPPGRSGTIAGHRRGGRPAESGSSKGGLMNHNEQMTDAAAAAEVCSSVATAVGGSGAGEQAGSPLPSAVSPADWDPLYDEADNDLLFEGELSSEGLAAEILGDPAASSNLASGSASGTRGGSSALDHVLPLVLPSSHNMDNGVVISGSNLLGGYYPHGGRLSFQLDPPNPTAAGGPRGAGLAPKVDDDSSAAAVRGGFDSYLSSSDFNSSLYGQQQTALMMGAVTQHVHTNEQQQQLYSSSFRQGMGSLPYSGFVPPMMHLAAASTAGLAGQQYSNMAPSTDAQQQHVGPQSMMSSATATTATTATAAPFNVAGVISKHH